MASTATARSIHPNSLANIRPWTAEDRAQRGSGRQRIAKYVRDHTKDGQEFVDFMLRIMRGESFRQRDRGHTRSVVATLPLRFAAAEWLANRAFGLPKEFIEVTEGDGPTQAERRTLIAAMNPEDREALRTLLLRALDAQTAPGPDAVSDERAAPPD